MTAFRTCHTCAIPAATCQTREALQAAIAGLRITSIKHRCADYLPAFQPGDAVKVLTIPFYPTEDEPHAPKLWFPGHFIRLAGMRAIVFVKPGARSLNRDHGGNDYAFEAHGGGYLKVPLSRVAVRDGEPVSVEACRWCASIPDLDGNCGRDPSYTPARDCLAANLAASRPADRSPGDETGRVPVSRSQTRAEQNQTTTKGGENDR